MSFGNLIKHLKLNTFDNINFSKLKKLNAFHKFLAFWTYSKIIIIIVKIIIMIPPSQNKVKKSKNISSMDSLSKYFQCGKAQTDLTSRARRKDGTIVLFDQKGRTKPLPRKHSQYQI